MSDKEFTDNLKQGKQAQYSQLLDKYQQKMFSTCISFVPNTEDAEYCDV